MSNELPVIKPEWLAGITLTKAQKDKWLAALRSGDYEQTDGMLCDSHGYCCMGVAGLVCFGLRHQQMASHGNLQAAGCLSMGTWIPGDWTEGSPESVQATLAYLNDVAKLSFPEIADFIEANIPACDAVQS